MNRLTKTSSSGNNEEGITTYDLLGRVSTQSSASGGSMSYTYDEWHRVASLTVNGETTAYTYDSYGNPSTVTDPQSRVTTYHYDTAQRITKVSEPGGDVLTAFDAYGNRTKITDSLSQDTTYAFDTANGHRLTKVTDAIGKTTHYFYDAYGRQTKVGAGSGGEVDPRTPVGTVPRDCLHAVATFKKSTDVPRDPATPVRVP